MKWNQFIIIIGSVIAIQSAQASMITVTGDAAAGTGALTINQDIVFTITTETVNTSVFFVFDEVVTADAESTYLGFSGLNCSINGGALIALGGWIDNVSAVIADMTPNDGYIFGSIPSLFVNDVVTLHAGTGTMTGTSSDFNLWASGDYNLFMINGDGEAITDAVPEPATMALLGVSGAILCGIRRFYLRRS